MKTQLYTILALTLAMASCKKDPEVVQPSDAGQIAEYEPGEELSAGSTTINDQSHLAFSSKIAGLNSQDNMNFFVGNSFFSQNWVEAPASTTARDGLGPMFNSRSCAGCHFRDGRGMPQYNKGILFRLSVAGVDIHGGPLNDVNYGGQLSDQALPGITKEGDFTISYTEIAGAFADGETYSLRKPLYTFSNLGYGALNGGILISPRIGNQMIGLGLIENVNVMDLIARADENDVDGDGISGKANYVHDPISNSTQLGRFGWKANVSNLYHQTAAAFVGDMGITSWLFPVENCTSPQNDCLNAPNGGVPEIDTADLEHTVLYTRVLAVPKRRNYQNTEVLRGKKVFMDAGCDKCHTPKMQTGNTSAITVLNNVTIRPFSDFLLHDMGTDLADGRPDYLANGNEWRTQPLWGLGLIQTVNGHTYLLHDGRARNIKEAILWHGGEAYAAKEYFRNISKKERDALILFLESL